MFVCQSMSIDGISVCVYTGLGISDVSTFHINRLLESGKCHIRTTKNGKKVYRWTPIWLQQRIRERAKFYGPLIFGSHKTTDRRVANAVLSRPRVSDERQQAGPANSRFLQQRHPSRRYRICSTPLPRDEHSVNL